MFLFAHMQAKKKSTNVSNNQPNKYFLSRVDGEYLRPVSFRLPKSNVPIFRSSERRSGRFFFILYLILVAILALVSLSHASPPPSRGARPIALGNGYVASSGDPYSLFYNPAGLAMVNEKIYTFDYGRSSSVGESSRSDFNVLQAMPYRYKDIPVPIAFGLYGEQDAPGSHVIDITAGGGADAPVDRWTKGIFKLTTKLGAAGTIRHSGGYGRSSRIGKSKIGLGVSGGALILLDKQNQVGVTLHNLFLGDSNPYGPSISVGFQRDHSQFLHMMCDLEYGSGGVWRFHPGAELLFLRGVLRPRIGWGFRDNGAIDSVATGIGFYASPVQLDISYLIPTKRLTDETSQFRLSLTHRFGRPQFSEIYYDRALEAAGQLDTQVLSLTTKEAEVRASLLELEQKRRMAQEDILNMKERIQTLKEQDLLGQRDEKIRQLQYRVKELEMSLDEQRGEVKQLREKKAEIKTHLVKTGDTLQSLAVLYYGDANSWKKIFNANADKIDRGLPRVGSEIIIP